jgi:hypothetical protein
MFFQSFSILCFIAATSASPIEPKDPTRLENRQDGSGSFGGVVGSIPVDSNVPVGSFQTATCTTPEITDASIDPEDRWNAVDTSTAWDAAVLSWQNRPSTNLLTFPEQISNYFHGRDGLLCSDLQKTNCDNTFLCSDVSVPAGYVQYSKKLIACCMLTEYLTTSFLLLNSFAAVHTVNEEFFKAMQEAQATVVTKAGDFASTFVEIVDPQAQLKILLDVVGLGFALIASPVWNSCMNHKSPIFIVLCSPYVGLKSVPFFAANGNTLGTVKDTVNPMVSNSITISKDSMAAATSALGAQNALTDQIGTLITQWTNTLASYNSLLFGGTDDGNTQLFDLIQFGHTLDFSVLPDTNDMAQSLQKTIFGMMIPAAWAEGNTKISPYIM